MSLERIAKKYVATITPEATVQDAAKMMRELHVGDVIIVKPGLELGTSAPIGILTDRDIIVSTVAFGVDPKTVLVKDVMSLNLTTAKITDSVFHVINLMKENGIKRIPLIDSEGTLVGILSADDLIGMLASEMTDISKIIEQQRNVEFVRRRRLA